MRNTCSIIGLPAKRKVGRLGRNAERTIKVILVYLAFVAIYWDTTSFVPLVLPGAVITYAPTNVAVKAVILAMGLLCSMFLEATSNDEWLLPAVLGFCLAYGWALCLPCLAVFAPWLWGIAAVLLLSLLFYIAFCVGRSAWGNVSVDPMRKALIAAGGLGFVFVMAFAIFFGGYTAEPSSQAVNTPASAELCTTSWRETDSASAGSNFETFSINYDGEALDGQRISC